MQLKAKSIFALILLATALDVQGAVADKNSIVQIERYQNGALYRETQYQNGKKNGYEKVYSLSGKVRTLWNYKNGKKEGEQKGWFEDSAKMFVYHYQNGVPEGEQMEWHQNGTLFRRQFFHHGYETDRKVFSQKGQMFSNYAKRDGRSYGVDGGTLCFDKKKDGEK